MNSDTFEGNRGRRLHHEHTARESSLASLLCVTALFVVKSTKKVADVPPSKLLVTMNQAPSRRTRGQENARLVRNCTWFFTDVTATIVVQSTVTSGRADVFTSSQAFQATLETQALIRLPREEPEVEKSQTHSKLHLVFTGVTVSFVTPIDNTLLD